MIKNWPTAIVAVALCVTIAATIITGLALEVDGTLMAAVLGGEGIGGVFLAAAMRGMFADDGDWS